MIGLDTNVLVRYLAQDHIEQARLATRLIESLSADEPGYLSTLTMAEIVWVLTRSYRFPKARIIDVLEGLLRAREIVVEDAETHYRALAIYAAQPVDYADAVIAEACARAGCAAVYTFDAQAAAAAGMRLLS